MGHNASKVLLGSANFSGANVTMHAGDPATLLAGLALRKKSDGTLTTVLADGLWAGISFGRNLSNINNKTNVCRAGLGIPVLVERQPARGVITITSYANLVSGTDDVITVGATGFTAQAGASTPGQAHFTAATGNNETATSLAAQINAHATAGALVKATAAGAVVTLTAKLNTTVADTMVLTYTDNDTNVGATVSGSGTLTDSDDTADWLTIGANAYFSDTTGKADDPNSAATVSNAVYVSGLLTGIAEDGTEVACALVDMPGGL